LAASFWAITESAVTYYCYTHCTVDFIKKIDFVQRASSVSYGFYTNKNLWCSSGEIDVLIKSAIQYNNSMTDTVVALYGAHLDVMKPRQHSYLHRYWSGGEPFATQSKIWPAWDSNSRPKAIAVNTVVQ